VRFNHKLHVAIAVRLLTVGDKKVSPAREHVAGHVFHDDGNTVPLLVESYKNFFIFQLRDGFVGELLVGPKRRQRIIKVVLNYSF